MIPNTAADKKLNTIANKTVNVNKEHDTAANKNLNTAADKIVNANKKQNAVAGKQLIAVTKLLMLIKNQIIRQTKLRSWIKVE